MTSCRPQPVITQTGTAVVSIVTPTSKSRSAMKQPEA
jgi:hypothetical protein